VFLIRRTAHPNVAVLGRIGETDYYSDVTRHPDNITYKDILILRIESSILYFNADGVIEKIMKHVKDHGSELKLVVLDLASAPYVDVAGSKMLLQLSDQLQKQEIKLKIVEALSDVRDILRKQGMEDVIGHISRRSSVDHAVQEFITGKSDDTMRVTVV